VTALLRSFLFGVLHGLAYVLLTLGMGAWLL
jgi:hypothetical protein